MVKKVLQINLRYKIPAETLIKAFMDVTQPEADVGGLEGKIWIHNAEEKTAGVIYVFKDSKSVNAYIKSRVVADLARNPGVYDVDAKVFDILPERNKVTRSSLASEL